MPVHAAGLMPTLHRSVPRSIAAIIRAWNRASIFASSLAV